MQQLGAWVLAGLLLCTLLGPGDFAQGELCITSFDT